MSTTWQALLLRQLLDSFESTHRVEARVVANQFRFGGGLSAFSWHCRYVLFGLSIFKCHAGVFKRGLGAAYESPRVHALRPAVVVGLGDHRPHDRVSNRSDYSLTTWCWRKSKYATKPSLSCFCRTHRAELPARIGA